MSILDAHHPLPPGLRPRSTKLVSPLPEALSIALRAHAPAVHSFRRAVEPELCRHDGPVEVAQVLGVPSGREVFVDDGVLPRSEVGVVDLVP